MKQRFVFAAVATFTLLTSPVSAEPVRLAQAAAPDVLPPHEILTIVRSTGLNTLGRPARRGAYYVLRAIGLGGEEVRVVVDARYGDIISVAPTATASRTAPSGLRMGPYEPVAPGGYVAPEPPPGVYQSGPPIVYETEPPVVYGSRPRAPVPAAPAATLSATPLRNDPAPPAPRAVPPLGEPQIIMAPEPGETTGLLPPPPERFQRRPLTPPAAAKPAHPKRAASATPGKPPLPKSRPAAKPAAEVDAAPLPPALPQQKPSSEAVPN